MDHCSHKRQELGASVFHSTQRRALVMVLVINLAMVIVEFCAGILANYSALQADAVDMLGDALVYAFSLGAVSRGAPWEAASALAKGLPFPGFFVFIVMEIISKLAYGAPPSRCLVLGFGAIPLIANLVRLALLWSFRSLNINTESTLGFSRNVVAADIDVLGGADGVALTGRGWPDIPTGSAIEPRFLMSAVGAVTEAWPAWAATTTRERGGDDATHRG